VTAAAAEFVLSTAAIVIEVGLLLIIVTIIITDKIGSVNLTKKL
jgi:hypothetical protein